MQTLMSFNTTTALSSRPALRINVHLGRGLKLEPEHSILMTYRQTSFSYLIWQQPIRILDGSLWNQASFLAEDQSVAREDIRPMLAVNNLFLKNLDVSV